MKILIVLNYYTPYISGVTETARIEAETLAKDPNNTVTVVCSNHDNLAKEEIINNVRVIRTPVIMKISKGTISPKFITTVKKISKEYDIVNIHSPMLEAGLISKLVDNKKLIVTYHCDVNLPSSFVNNFIVGVMDMSHKIAFKRANRIVVTSIDYASSSRVLGRFKDKLVEIAPPFKEIAPVKAKRNLNVIGFCGRIVEEKGIDVLLKAFQQIYAKNNKYVLKIAGDYKKIAGGSVYPKLKEYIESNNMKNVEFLGRLSDEELIEFYSSIGVFVLPSINSLEAFGMVQLEAMLCNTPVVASDLPGVRTIVQNTGMGLIAERKNEDDLAKKILEVLENRDKYVKESEEILKLYSTDVLVGKYRKLFDKIVGGKKVD